MICPLYEAEDDFAWMYRGMEHSGSAARMRRASKKKKEREKQMAKPSTPLFFGPGEPRIEPKIGKGKMEPPEPPPMPKSVQV